MTREACETTAADGGEFPRAVRRAWWWTTITWLAIVLLAGLSRLVLGPESMGGFAITRDAAIIAVASLGIAYASMVPGMMGLGRHRALRGSPSEAVGQAQTGQLVAGVMIRLLGTVALFLTCRYQMATPTELVAAMTIGWYVVLTIVDVMVLARELPSSQLPTRQLPPSQLRTSTGEATRAASHSGSDSPTAIVKV